MVKECQQNRVHAGGNAQPKPNPQGATTAEPPKKNRFYALKGRDEQEKSVDVVTCMLSFVTPLLALTFEILPEVMHETIVVSTPLGENVRTNIVYKDCPIVVCGKTVCADLVEYQCMILMLLLAWIGFIVIMLVWIIIVGL